MPILAGISPRPNGEVAPSIDVIREAASRYLRSKAVFEAAYRDVDDSIGTIADEFAEAEPAMIRYVLAMGDPRNGRDDLPRSITLDGRLYLVHPEPWSETVSEDGRPDWCLVSMPLADLVAV